MKPEGLEPNKLGISLKPEDMVGKFHVDKERKINAIRENAKRNLVNGLSNGYLDYIEADNLEGVDNVRIEDRENDYDDSYNHDSYYDDLEWERKQRLSKMPDEVKDSPEVIQAAIGGMLKCLSNGDIRPALEIKDIFSIPTEIIYNSDELTTIQEALTRLLSSDDNDGVVELINKFFPARSVEKGLSSEMEQLFKNILTNLISRGYVKRAIEIKSRLSLSQEIIASSEVQSAIKQRLIHFFQNSNIREAEHLKEQFSLTADAFIYPEVQKELKRLVSDTLLGKNYATIEYAIGIKDKFFLSTENTMQAAIEGFIATISNGDVRVANKIKDKFSLPPEIITSPEVQQAAESGILKWLNDNEYSYIENAIAIKDQFSVSPAFLTSPEMEQVVRKVVAEYLSREYPEIEGAVKIKDQFLLSELATRDAAKEGMIAQIKRGRLYDAKKIRTSFSVSDDVLQSPEVREATIQAIIERLHEGGRDFINEVLEIRIDLAQPEEVLFSPAVQQAAEKAMLKCLTNGDGNDANRIKSSFSLPTELTSSVAVQQAAKAGMAKCLAEANEYEILANGSTRGADNIKDMFSLSTENTALAAKEGMMARLSDGNIAGANAIQEKFSVSQEVLDSTEVQQAAMKGMLKCLGDGSIESALKIKDKFSLSVEAVAQAVKAELVKCLVTGSAVNATKIKNHFVSDADIFISPEVIQAIKAGIIVRLSEGNVVDAITIKDGFSVTSDIILSPEVQEAGKKGVVKHLSGGDTENALKIRDQFSLSREATQGAVVEGMVKRLKHNSRGEGLIDDALKIKDIFSLSEELEQQVARETLEYYLTERTIEYALKIKDRFSITPEDTLKVAKRAFLKCLVDGHNEERTEQIKEKFKVSVSSEDILDFFPEMRQLLSDLRDISPEFATQAEKTPDLLLSLLEFRSNPKKIIDVAKANPFLLDAIVSNPRFGSRLLIKYPQFDRISKENIKTQCEAKKKIISEHPDIDPQSVEFRTRMQDSLIGYGKNKEVIADIDAKGLNSERWLNYDETTSFNLGSNENTLAFSEIITTPINRIKETIDTYAYTIKEVLSEYRTELMAFEIKLGKSEPQSEELQKMTAALEKARSEGNTKKALGIEKGIENLKARSSQERKSVLWEKLLADVASFQRLKDDVFKAQETFVGTEKELENAITEKMPSGKKIQEIKRKMAGAKEDLRTKFVVMERRIEEFRANLKNMIAPALGDNRADALIQEINTRLAEQFNHFDTDRGMLKNLFGEQSDKKKEDMESRPMSIFVWTRDPDIDLYQGNYSPCCICIDSDYHGAESPIADYNIDLGIQIVNVWDETKNEPVTAAWCWLGEDEKGEPALVVDNIEANTLFSANFSEQFTNELFKYIKEYAKAVGVKKVVLGKANNDLPTAGELSKLPDSTGKYKKIGGANRSDGYFLEAEDRTVKIIWEKGVKSQIKKSETGTKKPGVERVMFSEISSYPLTEEDFREMRELERRVYATDSELIQGLELVRDIKEGKGLDYSVAIWGVPEGSTKQEMVAYAVAVEDETDEGDKSVYLEDIAVAPEAQRQGVGRRLIQDLVQRLKAKATTLGEPVLFDMHLRPNSLAMLDTQRETLAGIGVVPIEEVLVPDYYDEGDDAVYRVYEVAPASRN